MAKFQDKRHGPEVYKPADAADYLHGPMPKYSEEDGGHLHTFRGKTVNMNAHQPFDDYYDGTPGVDEEPEGDE